MKKTIIVMFVALISLTTRAAIINGSNESPVPTWNSVTTNYFVVTAPSGPYTFKTYAYKPGDTILINSDSMPESGIGRKTRNIFNLASNTLYHYKTVVTKDSAVQVIDGSDFTTLPLPVRPRIDSITEIQTQGISKVIVNGYANGYRAGFHIYYYDNGVPKMTDTIYKSGNFRDTFVLLTPNIGTYEYYVIETNDTSVKSFLSDTLILHDSLIVTTSVIIRTPAPAISVSDTSVSCGWFTADIHVTPAIGDTSWIVGTYGTDGVHFADTSFIETDLDGIITLFERKVPMVANQDYWIKITGISKDGLHDSIIIRTHSRAGQAPTLLRLVEGINSTRPIIIVLGDAGCDYTLVSVKFTNVADGTIGFSDSIIVGPTSYQDTLLIPPTLPDGTYTILTCATNTSDYVCKIMTIQKGLTTGFIDHLSQPDIDPDTRVSIYDSSGKLIVQTTWGNVNEFIPFNNACTIKDSNGMLLERRVKM